MPTPQQDGGYLLPVVIDPPERICILIEVPKDQNHLLAFWGALSELGYWWNWQRDPLKKGALVANVWREVIQEARECYLELLPMSICDIIDDIQNQVITNEYLSNEFSRITQNNIRTTNYDGTNTSVNVNVPTTFVGVGIDGDNALCNAVNQYVRVKMLEAVNLVRVLFGAQVLAATALGILTGGLGMYFGGVALAVGSITLDQYNDAIDDAAALDLVVCNLVDLLTGTVTQGNFTAAINALTSSSTNEATIINTLKQGAGDLTNYLYFIDLLGTAQALAANGIYSCPCTDEWCYTFDFTIDNGGWSAVSGFSNYVAGVAWRNDAIDQGGGLYDTINAIDITFPSSVLTSVTVSGFASAAGAGGSRGVYYGDARTLYGNLPTSDQGFISTVENTLTTTRIGVNVDISNSLSTDYTEIYQITLRGNGTNPFGMDNC